MSTKKVIQVCKPDECGNKVFTVKVASKTHKFCCEKGFNKTLDEFAKTVNTKPPTHGR